MNKKHHYSSYRLIITLAFFLFSTTVIAREGSTLEELLSKIKMYDYGQNRVNLTQFEKYIRLTLDSPDALKEIQSGMLAVLESDATFAAKQFICQQLSIFGDEDAVPVLAEMLRAPETSDIARYALERIPGEKVDAALRRELSRSKGLAQIGIINTLGQRRDRRSADDFGKLINSRDANVAAAAISALGNIGDKNSANILKKSIQETTGNLRMQAMDSYLKCGDKLAANGESKNAMVIYDHLFGKEFLSAIRSAALRGKVKLAERPEEHIIKIITDENELITIRADALSLIDELPASVKVDRCAAELQRLPNSLKIILLNELAQRGDISVLHAIRKAAADADGNVRMEAYRTLAALGNESDVDVLVKAAATSGRDESEVARECLCLLQGEKVDEAILSKIHAAEAAEKVELIAAIDRRMIPGTTPLLLELAKHPARKVRSAAYKSLEATAEPVHFSDILNLLKNADTKSERTRLERTLVAVASKFPETESPSELILSEITDITDIETRSSLIKVLGVIGEPQALPVLRTYLTDKNEDIRIAAIYAFSDYPNPAPMEDLLRIAQSSENEVQRILALRGYIRLIRLDSDRAEDSTIDLYLNAMQLAENVQEKRMVISGLSNVYTVRSFEIVASYLENDEMRPEAEVALLELAKKVSWRAPEATKVGLQKLIDLTQNEQLKIDARELLIQMSL